MKRFLLLALPLLALAVVTVPSFAHGGPEDDGRIRIRVDTLVPLVVGLSETDVVAGLEGVYRLEVVDVAVRRRRDGRDGRVVAQVPEAGERLRLGDVLRIEVGRRSLAVEQRPLPSLVGLDMGEAERILLRRGLVPHAVVVRGHHRGAWTILRQRPGADALVSAGDEVRLEVAVPRRLSAAVRLPSLYGLEPAAAMRVLSAFGLRASIERRPSVFETDTVIETAPIAGAVLSAGSTVRLRVAVPTRQPRRVARVVVPDLDGRPLPAIRAAIREAGLRLDIRRRVAPEAPLGRVLSQRPRPGARIPLGGFVAIEVPAAADVPELLGQRAAGARHLAEEAGFTLELAGSATFGTGRVVSQVPAAGTRAVVGSRVRAVLRSPSFGPGGAPGRRLDPAAPARRGGVSRGPRRR